MELFWTLTMICETNSTLKRDPFKAPNKSQKVLSYFRCLKIPKDVIFSARKCQNVGKILYSFIYWSLRMSIRAYFFQTCQYQYGEVMMDIKYQVDFNPNTLFHSKYSPLNSVQTGCGSVQSLVCLQTF